MKTTILRSLLSLTALFLCSCATSQKSQSPATSLLAVDLCEPVTQVFLDAAKTRGVGTIIRYYDHPNETIRGKTPLRGELDLIKANDFQMLAVFQHNNNRLATFTTERGKMDATRAVTLAKQWGQPSGSAIYFGADNDFAKSSEQTAVKNYASAFAEVVRKSGYKMGAYGSGQTLENLLNAGIIDYAWISQSRGFKGTKEFFASGRWSLKQEMPSDFGGLNVDFNQVNPNKPEFGQWQVR